MDLTIDELRSAATDILNRPPIAGTDKVGRDAFRSRLEQHLTAIAVRANTGTYRFSRYRQRLRLKGAHSKPREICIPTYRDRVLLLVILRRLERVLNTDIDREIPNAKIRRIRAFVQQCAPTERQFVRADVKDFFDSIDHARLKEKLRKRGVDEPLLQLVIQAISQTTTTGLSRTRGIPQGLSISPALANTFLSDLFSPVSNCLLFRHLDDILLVGPGAQQHAGAIRDALQALDLAVNGDKSSDGCLESTKMRFLGYEFSGAWVRATNDACNKFLSGVDRIVGQHRARSARYFTKYMTVENRNQAFVSRLNRKIQGAIYGNHNYGWVSYYSATNDPSQLRWLDSIIARILDRHELGRFLTQIGSMLVTWNALRQSRTSPEATNFDLMTTEERQVAFLHHSGEMDADGQLTTEQIRALFERVRGEELRDLERDVGVIS